MTGYSNLEGVGPALHAKCFGLKEAVCSCTIIEIGLGVQKSRIKVDYLGRYSTVKDVPS